MQDKEIDRLFNLKFENFEAEPSSKTWVDIASELEVYKRKKTLIPYMSIAASVLIVLGVGLYFMPQVKPGAKKRVQTVVAKNNTPLKAIIAPVAVIKKKVVQRAEKNTAANEVKSNTEKTNYGVSVNYDKIPVAEITELKPAEQFARSIPGNKDSLTAVVPDTEIPLITKVEINEEVPFITKPAVLAASPQDSKALAAMPVKKHRIHNLGDLINVVVGKVDKRKDKVIEFTNTDDDEPTITGLNLGLIRIKKQE